CWTASPREAPLRCWGIDGIPWISRDPLFRKESGRFFQHLYRAFDVEEQHISRLGQMLRGMDPYGCRMKLDVSLVEGDAIPGMPEWTVVVATPGHAPHFS